MEAIPSELMYSSEGRGSHTYQSTATQIVNQIVPMEGPLGSVAMPTKQEILQFQEVCLCVHVFSVCCAISRCYFTTSLLIVQEFVLFSAIL